MKDGRVVDQGRYDQLMEVDRWDQTFRKMAIAQRTDPVSLKYGISAGSIDEKNGVMLEALAPVGLVSGTHLNRSQSRTSLSGDASPPSVNDWTVRPSSQHHTGPIDGDVSQPVSPEGQKEQRGRQGFLKLVHSARWLFLIGALAGVFAGSAFPLVGWMTGESIRSLSDPPALSEINTWSLWFLILAIVYWFVQL
jgi:hypothetical protein